MIEFLKVICHAKGDILLGPGGTMTTLSEKGKRFNRVGQCGINCL